MARRAWRFCTATSPGIFTGREGRASFPASESVKFVRWVERCEIHHRCVPNSPRGSGDPEKSMRAIVWPWTPAFAGVSGVCGLSEHPSLVVRRLGRAQRNSSWVSSAGTRSFGDAPISAFTRVFDAPRRRPGMARRIRRVGSLRLRACGLRHRLAHPTDSAPRLTVPDTTACRRSARRALRSP